MIVEELIAMLGFELKGEDNLKKFKSGINSALGAAQSTAGKMRRVSGNMMTIYGAMATAVTGMGLTMFKMAKSAAEPLDKMYKLSGRLGESFEKVQLWAEVAGQSNVSFDTFASNLTRMSERISQADRGIGTAKKTLAHFGISARNAAGDLKKPTELLTELMGKFKTLSSAERLDLAKKLGLSPDMVNLLIKGADDFEKVAQQVRDAGLIFSEQDGKNAENFNDALRLFSRTIDNLKTTLGASLLPVMTDVIQRFQDWYNANKEWVKSGSLAAVQTTVTVFIALATALERIGKAAVGIAGWLGDIIKSLSGGKIDTAKWWILAGAIGALAFWLAPAYTSAIALIAALDDLLAWWEGDKSVIGAIIESFKSGELSAALDEQAAAMGEAGRKWASDLIAGFGAKLDTQAAEMGAWGRNIATAIWNGITSVPMDIWNYITGGGDPGGAAGAEIGSMVGPKKPLAHPKSGRLVPTPPISERFGHGASPVAPMGGEQLQRLIANMNSNLAKMAAQPAVDATITDARQDNRQFPMNTTVNVGGVHVAAPSAAPGALGAAVGNAAAGSINAQQTRIEQEPAQ